MTVPAASHARDVTDEQWVLIGPFLPKLARRTDGRGRPWRENRAVLNGILWILRTGAPWADLPETRLAQGGGMFDVVIRAARSADHSRLEALQWRASLANRGDRPRELDITSYAEVVLASPAADALHPAFSNLFVQTEIIRRQRATICTHRPRSQEQFTPWMLHLMAVHGAETQDISYETDRMKFIGRGKEKISIPTKEQFRQVLEKWNGLLHILNDPMERCVEVNALASTGHHSPKLLLPFFSIRRVQAMRCTMTTNVERVYPPWPGRTDGRGCVSHAGAWRIHSG